MGLFAYKNNHMKVLVQMFHTCSSNNRELIYDALVQ
jgi:hypothetical protein